MCFITDSSILSMIMVFDFIICQDMELFLFGIIVNGKMINCSSM